MDEYDPDIGPEPEAWLSLEEDERLSLVQDFVRAGERLRRNVNPRLHAAVHLVVENQIAMGDETPVATTLRRLLAQGLERHDAVHAIGSVLSKHIHRAMRLGDMAAEFDGDPNESYWHDLDALTAESWRRDR